MEDNSYPKMCDLKMSLEDAKALYHTVPVWFKNVLVKNFGDYNFYRPQDIKTFEDCCIILGRDYTITYGFNEQIVIIVKAYNRIRAKGHRVDVSYKSGGDYWVPVFGYDNDGTYCFTHTAFTSLHKTGITHRTSHLFLHEEDAALAGQVFVEKYKQYYV